MSVKNWWAICASLFGQKAVGNVDITNLRVNCDQNDQNAISKDWLSANFHILMSISARWYGILNWLRKIRTEGFTKFDNFNDLKKNLPWWD